MATGSEDSSLKVLDVARIKAAYHNGAPEKPVIRTLYDHIAPVNDVHFHPNGTVLASCSHDQSIKLFDIQKPTVKRSFRYFQVCLLVLLLVTLALNCSPAGRQYCKNHTFPSFGRFYSSRYISLYQRDY